MKLSELAEQVISLSDAIENYWETELPKRHKDYPIVNPGEDSGPPPPEEEKLRMLLGSLPEDMFFKLLLIRGLGRREFGTSDLAERVQELKKTFGNRKRATRQLIDRGFLGADLSDGLDELKKANVDVDKVTFQRIGSRK